MNIFITGSSSGLGLSLAERFLKAGDAVLGIGRREFKPNFRYLPCDITRVDEIKMVFAEMLRQDFIPDIAVFCAGSAIEDIEAGEFKAEKFRENFDLNLQGALYWIELLLPYFLKRKKGTFAAISSMSIFRETRKRRIGYSASKAALNKCFANLRLAYLDSGIQFVIFNMGRMGEEDAFVGTTYNKAAARIYKIIKSPGRPHTVNIPFRQFLLTKAAALIPDKVFKNNIMK